MEDIRLALQQLIRFSEPELATLLQDSRSLSLTKRELLLQVGQPVDWVYFIQSGWLRVILTDISGKEHSVHFARAGEFITDYTSFLKGQVACYSLQALTPLAVLALPRSGIEWGYQHMEEGDRLGRLIAEHYFVYQDQRLRALYTVPPKVRYDQLEALFPNLHQHAPQHMVASYLGITPIHLSRLKKAALTSKS